MTPIQDHSTRTHLKAFALALFCHGAFFSVCAFTFSSRVESQKPTLIFLGSLLKQYDLQNIETAIIAYAPNEIPATTMEPRLNQEGEAAARVSSSDKPVFDKHAPSAQKKVFKPRLDLSQTPGSADTSKNPAADEPAVPARMPLKLDIK